MSILSSIDIGVLSVCARLAGDTYFARPMKSSYKYRCRFDNRHMTTCSYFFGICFSTSDFRRRSKNGRNTYK